MPNLIACTKNYTSILDAVYQRASVSGCLTSGHRMVRAGRNAKEIMIPKIEVSGLGDYTCNVGYKTGSINYAFETKVDSQVHPNTSISFSNSAGRVRMSSRIPFRRRGPRALPRERKKDAGKEAAEALPQAGQGRARRHTERPGQGQVVQADLYRSFGHAC